jgi:hypothetical protein
MSIRHVFLNTIRKFVIPKSKKYNVVVNTPASYSGGPGFKSRSGDRQSWLRFSWFSSIPSGKCWDNAKNWTKTATLGVGRTASFYVGIQSLLFASFGTLRQDVVDTHRNSRRRRVPTDISVCFFVIYARTVSEWIRLHSVQLLGW